MRFSFVFAALIALTSVCLAEPPCESAIAVQTAARHYRMEIYDSFRQSREQYDQWRAVGDMLVEHWNSAGQPNAWNDELTQWFDEATEACRNQGQLPQLPDLMPVANDSPATDDVQAVIPADVPPTTTEQPVATDSAPQATETPAETTVETDNPQADSGEAKSDEATSGEATSNEVNRDETQSGDAAAAPSASDQSFNERKDAKIIESIGGAFWRAVAE